LPSMILPRSLSPTKDEKPRTVSRPGLVCL
jgi:hypothetical protein